MIKRALILTFALGLSACGYRGALYLPEPQAEQNTAEQQPSESDTPEAR